MSIDDRLRDGLRRNGAAVPDHTESALDGIWQRRGRRLRLQRVAAILAVLAAVAVAPWAAGQLRQPDAVVATSSPSDLIGTWAVDVPAGAGEVTGRWVVTVRPDGGVDLDPPPGFSEDTAGTTLQVTGSTLRTNAFIHYPGCQLPGAVIGQYSWTRSGSTVAFRRISDECQPRQRLFAAPWELQ